MYTTHYRFILSLLAGMASSAVLAQNMVGLGVAAIPDYPGSDSYRVTPAPLIDVERGSLFISTRYVTGTGVGMKFSLGKDLVAGPILSLSPDRDESRNSRLVGLGDIDFSALYGGFAEWTPGRFRTSIHYLQSAKSEYGSTFTWRGSYTALRSGKHTLTVGGDLTWGDNKNMQTWFGITPEQAASSRAGLPVYKASSGLRSASAFASWHYRYSKDWALLGTVGLQPLLGDAVDSPLTERKSSGFGFLGLTYNF